MQWRRDIETAWEKTQRQHLQNKFLPLWKSLPRKGGELGAQTSRHSPKRGDLYRAVSQVVGSNHFPIDLLTRWYATLPTPILGIIRKCSMSCMLLGDSLFMAAGLGSMWVSHFVRLGLRTE